MELTYKTKQHILKILLSENDLFKPPFSENNIIDFLDEIFNLKALPSEDDRYDNAYDDAYKHLVSNDDWDYEYVFTKRFNVIEDTKIFIIFLNNIIHPSIREDEETIDRYFLLINPYLEKENLSYSITSYNDSSLPIYEVKAYDKQEGTPPDIIKNKIPFYVANDLIDYDVNLKKNPKEYPFFILFNNSDWNDFDNYSTYRLNYYKSSENDMFLGYLKIIHREAYNTPDVLKDGFTQLSKDYCSLGLEFSYYENMRNIFGKRYKSILWAIKDVALFPDIAEEFENEYYFKKSLIRFDEHEELFREAKFKLKGFSLKDLYSFKYTFKPKFAEEAVEIDFKFKSKGPVPDRIFALIGKNGTGKTQLMTSLPQDIANDKKDVFDPRTPLFGKIIAVSYSAFDRFVVPKKTSDFNYVYCGLRKADGEIYSERGLKLRFHNSWKKIVYASRFEKWVGLLHFFLDENLIDELIVEKSQMESARVDLKGFNNVSKKLSSGQSIMLYIMTEIVANIRYGSLIIYDEPETHLHPNAISQLINAIYQLTEEFNSYCILATHSPLIVKELFSKNVYIMEKENSVLSVRRPINETFGENLTLITDDIFGNTEVINQYKVILRRLVNKNYSFDKIISLISSENNPLSLNTRIYLKSIIDDKS